VQTVEREMAPRFHALLEEIGRRTGIPVLLNTSFNLAGEPIVNRAVEAYSTFRRSGIDLLVCGRDVVRKKREATDMLDGSTASDDGSRGFPAAAAGARGAGAARPPMR